MRIDYRPPMEKSGEEQTQQAMAAMARGELSAAAQRFEAAARGFLAEGKRGPAMASLSNLAFVRKGLGELSGALSAVDEAIALLPADADDKERGPLLLTRAGVLDRLADPRAAETWRTTAEAMRAQPLLHVVCLAHAAGALMATDPDEARKQALAAVRLLGGEAPLSMLVCVIGAVGDSAPHQRGVPFLAQTVLLMFAHPETCNASNAPFLEMLAERMGYAQPIAETLIVLGLLLSNATKGRPDHQTVTAYVVRVLQSAAAARSIPVEEMAKRCHESRPAELGELIAKVEQLVGEHWLIRGSVELS
jgi:tetratricopeptide (TPR) repeat protein